MLIRHWSLLNLLNTVGGGGVLSFLLTRKKNILQTNNLHLQKKLDMIISINAVRLRNHMSLESNSATISNQFCNSRILQDIKCNILFLSFIFLLKQKRTFFSCRFFSAMIVINTSMKSTKKKPLTNFSLGNN